VEHHVTPRLRVLTTREEIRPERLVGSTAVVIDVFMATTTLLTILENGARSVRPVATLEEAEAVRRALDPASVLRGGEQGAQRVEGYELGPFPEEFSPEVVRGKDVVFISTNGTVAISESSVADRVLLASMRNAQAVARTLQEEAPESIHLICAGSLGRPSLEDLAGAAAILARMDLSLWALNDGAWLAHDLGVRYGERIAEVARQGRAGRWFERNGREETFRFLSAVGASELVAEVRGGRLLPVPRLQLQGGGG
jgi:2-phosphosulfolactate phosphatase